MPSPRLPRQPPTALRSSTRSTTALTARITRPLVPRSGPARSTSRPTNGLRSPATSPTSGPASPVGPPRSGPTSPATPPTSGPASRVTPPRSGPSSPATSQASGASEEGAAVTAAATIPIPEKARPSNAPTTDCFRAPFSPGESHEDRRSNQPARYQCGTAKPSGVVHVNGGLAIDVSGADAAVDCVTVAPVCMGPIA